MSTLSESLSNALTREGWRASWARQKNPDGTLAYQAAADRENVHLCAEGRGLTEALARLWQLCNQWKPQAKPRG